MKNTRKILTVILALALSVACFTVFAFADGEAGKTTEELYQDAIASHEKVLEYFEAGYYLNADFEGVTDFDEALSDSSDEFSVSKGGAFSAVIEDGALNVSSIGQTYFDVAPETPGSFGLRARVKVTEDSSFALYLHSSARGSLGDYLRLFSISAGKVSHKLDLSAFEYQVSDSGVEANTYFDIEFFLEKTATHDIVSLEVTPEGKETEEYYYIYDNTSNDFLSGKFDYETAYIATEDATIDDIEFYKGTFPRSIDVEEATVDIANAIVAMNDDYNRFASKVEDKGYAIYDIIASIAVKYGFDYSTVNDDLKASVTSICQSAVNVIALDYVGIYADAVANIDVNAPYYDRVAHVESLAVYSDFINNVKSSQFKNVTGLDYDVFASNVAKVEEEVLALDKAKADTIASVEAAVVIPNIYLASYVEYKAAYDVMSKHPICITYYDDEITADAVNLSAKVANVVLQEFPKLEASAKAFTENVPVAVDTSLSFAVRYAAYVIAKNNIFTDSSYDVYLDGATIASLNASFAMVDVVISEVSAIADQFIGIVDEANKSSSYSVKIVLLDEAAAYKDVVEVEYPGIADAIALYDSMRDEISNKILATKNYIQAVIDAQSATTIADKKAAIANAKELAIMGSDVSVEVSDIEMTVTEANVILSNIESEIVLKETQISNFVAAVDNIGTKSALLDKRQAINKAMLLKAGLDESESAVADASAKLNAAIASYNATVASANSEADETDETALEVLKRSVPTKRIAEIVAIIKKFYE